MRKLLLLLTVLSVALLSPPSSKAQFIVVGQACGAGGLTGTANDGTPVVCRTNPPTSTSLVWVAVGGSSGSGSSLGASINVKTVNGAFGDAVWVQGVTISRTASTLTLPAGTNSPTSGMLIQCGSNSFGANEVVPYPPNNGGQTLPATITSVNGLVVTYNTTPVNSGTPLVDGQCIFGHDDTTAIKNAFTTCKTLSYSPQFASNGPTQNAPCNVYLPRGNYMISATVFDGSPIATYQNATGVGIIGDGNNTSVIYPVIGYNNTAPSGCGFVLCGVGWGQIYRDFGIDGAMSLNTVGWNFANTHVTSITCGHCEIDNIKIQNFYGASLSNQFMMALNGGGPIINYPRFENTAGGATGYGAFQCSACSTDIYTPFFSNTPQNLSVSNAGGRGSGGYFNVHGGIIDEGSVTQIVNSKAVGFYGLQLMGGANCISVDATSEVRMSGGYCGTFNGGAGGGGPTVASGGKLWMADVEVSANGAGQSCYNNTVYGGIIDLGGNLCILAGGATAYKTGSFVNQFALTHLPINGFQSGTLTAGTVQSVAVDQPMSVSSLTWTPSNAFACTAGSFPTFSISDGTTTLTTAATDTATNGAVTHTFSQTAANLLNPSNVANTVLQIKVVTTGTCSTAPTNVNINVWGQASAPSF